MEWRKISSVLSESISFETWEYLGEYIHIAKALGPVRREDRLANAKIALQINKSGHFFRLLDNSSGHDSLLSYEDMLLFGNMLKEAGIKRIFNAAVTHDTAHPSVSRLLTAVSEIMEIETETFCTPHYDEAFNFIKTKVEKFAGYA